MPVVPLRQFKVLLLRDTLPDLQAALKPDEDGNTPPPSQLAGHVPFNGAVYFGTVNRKSPDWLPFLNEGLAETKDIHTSTASAVLLLETRNGHRFALTYGYGRYLLQPSAYVRDFGIRVALNAIASGKLRSVDMRRVEGLVLHTRRQTSKASSLDMFGVDKSHDLIQSIAGLPEDENLGRRFEGSDAFTIAARVEFVGVADYCDSLYELYNSDDYKEEYGFFDNLRVVKDPGTIAELDASLDRALAARALDKMHLVQPEAESLADVNYYAYSARGAEHLDLDITEFVAERLEVGAELTAERLKNEYVRVQYGHQAGAGLAKWRIYDCIVFETEDDEGNIFMLASGDWHKASPDFIAEINAQLATLEISSLDLPPASPGETEPAYNPRAAAHLGCICTDAKPITLQGMTPIELCDLLTEDGHLIHVKRKTQSASLSHLFNQGLVSSDLLVQHRPFRKGSRDVIKKLVPGKEEIIPLNAFDPSGFEVVYAVIAKDGTVLPDDLPLFSKVTLAGVSKHIQDVGFTVSLAAVPVR